MKEQKLTVSVKQAELEEIVEHKREIAWHQKKLESIEKEVKDLLVAGSGVEDGRFTARMDFRRRKNVAWKQLVIEQLGQAFSDETWKKAPYVTMATLVVVEHPPLPLWENSQ